MDTQDGSDAPPPVGARSDRWAYFELLEVAALAVGLAAADRDGSIDHTGKALHAELEEELSRRLGSSA